MKKEARENNISGPACPLPLHRHERVLLAHGGGGKLSAELLHELVLPPLSNPLLDMLHDGALLDIPGNRLAFTTDSYVVQPIFFPGGDIGELAVYGTVNDLACCGAKPLYLSLSLIIEEGLEMTILQRIMASIKQAAHRTGVNIVTGDTKVVDRGKGDQVFINTSGIGIVPDGINISPFLCRPGDQIILSGNIGDHGMAVMSTRAGLSFESPIISDCAPVNQLVEEALRASSGIRVMRDPTRGGVASALNEISRSCGHTLRIYEDRIPVSEPVKGACEIFGLDPLYIANEGKILLFVEPREAGRVLEVMKKNPLGQQSAIIGEVLDQQLLMVEMITTIGTSRIIDMISGEQLPRIC